MKFKRILIIFLMILGYQFHAQKDSIVVELKALKDISKDKLKKDKLGNFFYYDEKQKARIYEIDGEKVIVMDELMLLPKPHFNNQLDRNFYFFLNKKLNRVYPYFITALEQYRDIQDELAKIDSEQKRVYIKKRQEELANQYEKQLKDLTTTEGRIFAKLMYTFIQLVSLLSLSFWQSLEQVCDGFVIGCVRSSTAGWKPSRHWHCP